MNVKDLMTVAPVVIAAEETCQEATARMRRHGIRHLPVVDAAGSLEGIITDRDLRHHLLSPSVLPNLGRVSAASLLRQARVREVMSWPVFVTAPGAEFAEAAKVMRERHVGALPVVEGRRLVGIITETDLLRRIVAIDTAGADDDTTAIVVSYP